MYPHERIEAIGEFMGIVTHYGSDGKPTIKELFCGKHSVKTQFGIVDDYEIDALNKVVLIRQRDGAVRIEQLEAA